MIFTCAMCGWSGVSDWSDDEAQAEYEEVFGIPYDQLPEHERAVVCDDCYERMGLTTGNVRIVSSRQVLPRQNGGSGSTG